MIPLFRRSRIMDYDETLSVIRETVTEYEEGKPTKREQFKFAIRANVQPVNTRDLMLMPEGDRFKEQLLLYAPEVPNVPKIKTNDKVYRDGVYVVQSADDWGSYVRARMMRVDVGPDIADQFEPPRLPRAC